jgi:microcystin degradation protein MlrC
MKKKIAVGMISHETNVFSPVPTPLQSWKDRVLVIGNDLIKKYSGTKSAVGAFLEAAAKNDWEIIPTIATSATPSAPTDAATYKYLKDNLLKPIIDSKPDAVLLSVHGAMIAEGVEDPEGDIAQSIREIIRDKPLLLTMDLHGNITENMCNQCNGIFAYDTNPHIDGYERAIEATECLEKIFANKINPINAYTHKSMMPPTINMRTAEGPMVELHCLAKEWEAKEGIINVSIFSGFPYGDVPHAGLSIVTTADLPYLNLAKKCSDTIGNRAWQIREQFLKEIPSAVEGLDQTQKLLKNDMFGPVVLADVADNPGGGGSGDTTVLLKELIKRNIPKSAAAIIWDPETVQKAVKVGVGNSSIFHIGGKAEPNYGKPIEVEGKVRILSDGRFIARGPVGRGMEWNMGESAVIQVGEVKIVISSIRIACNDADIFRSVGIDPEEASVLLVKSRGHFRASFEPLARSVIEIDEPGAANPSLNRYEYKNLARPIFPLDKF